MNAENSIMSRKVRKGHGFEGHLEFYGERVILMQLSPENISSVLFVLFLN